MPNDTMTLDIPQPWLETFAAAETPEEWDRILRVASRCSKSVYAAAQKACSGRDTQSLKTQAYREQCREEYDGF